MLRVFASSILVFLYIYNISFSIIPPISTGRAVFLLMIAIYWRDIFHLAKKIFTENALAFFVIGACFLWTAVLYIQADYQDSTQLSRFFHFYLFVILGSIAVARLINFNSGQFLLVFGLAAALQAAFIFFALFSDGFRAWTEANLVQGGNISLEDALRVAGLSNSSGALLSLIQGLGVISLLFSAKNSKTVKSGAALLLFAIMTLLSCIPTGRTGLFVGGIAFLFFLCWAWKFKYFAKKLLLAVLLIPLLISPFYRQLIELYADAPQLVQIADWAFELIMSGDSESVRDLSTMPIPALTAKTLVGTGVVSRDDGVNASGHDSGYIQLYYAIGLPMALYFYCAFSAFFIKMTITSKERWGLLALLMVLALEVKEPFIFKYILPFYFLTLIICKSQERQNGKVGIV